MCSVDALCCIVLVFFFFFLHDWNFPSQIKNGVYFCKRDYLCGLMPRSMVCTNSSRQERRDGWRNSCPPAVAWDAVEPPALPPRLTRPLPQLILCQCSASRKAFSTHLLLSYISFCERQEKTDCYMNKVVYFLKSDSGVLEWRGCGGCYFPRHKSEHSAVIMNCWFK